MPPPPPKLDSIAPLPLSPLGAGFWLWAGWGWWRIPQVRVEGREGHCMARIKYLRRHWYANVHNSPHTFRPLCNFHWEQRQIKYPHVISYLWLFAIQRSHQAFVFYDSCHLVIPSLIWRLRALECFSSNLESDLSSAVTRDYRTL